MSRPEIVRRVMRDAAKTEKQEAVREKERIMESFGKLATTGKKLKVTVLLDAAPFLQLGVPPDTAPSRTDLAVTVGGRTLHADVATKAVRKAVRTLQEHGEAATLMIQGSLGAGDKIDEAGLVVQVRASA